MGGGGGEAKGLPAGDPLTGEEWLAGPCALMVGCNGLIATLEQLEEKTFLRRIPLRTLADGRLALRVVPGTLWDRLLLSGVLAEIWMQPGVTRAHLDRYAARAYDIPPAARQGKLALVLAPAMWPRLRHWMCYTSCLLRIRSAC